MTEESKRSQIDRFREAARELGCDESEERFKDALRKIAKAPPAPAGNSRQEDVRKTKGVPGGKEG